VITDLATEWLKKHSRENFFLFLHYWDCHYDYVPPAPYDRKFDPGYQGAENGRRVFERERDILKYISVMDLAHMMALYDGEIAHTDEHVGRILQLLQDLGISERTLVIVLSDHGEAFLQPARERAVLDAAAGESVAGIVEAQQAEAAPRRLLVEGARLG